MGWDSARPVPWRRFLKEGVVFGLGMAAVFFVFAGERKPGSFIGIGVGAVFYVLICATLAKLGHVRMTLRQMRSSAVAAQRAKAGPTVNTPVRRPKPAPTGRTGGGTSKRRK